MTLAPHGTFARYRAGCHDTCCRKANARKTNLWRLGRADGYLDGTGTRRRLHALRRIGWTNSHIADAAGLTERAIAALLTTRSSNRKVLTSTARRIADAYDQLSMRRGPIVVLTGRAAAWPPPLAWDDDSIDDPAAQPAHQLQAVDALGKPLKRRGPTSHVHPDDVTFLADQGLPRAAIAERLGVEVGTLQTALQRAGRRDLWVRLCDREAIRRDGHHRSAA